MFLCPDKNHGAQFSIEICTFDLVGITFRGVEKYPLLEAVNIPNLHLNDVGSTHLVGSLHVNDGYFPAFEFRKLVWIEDCYLRDTLVAMKVKHGVWKRNESLFSVFVAENLAKRNIVFYIYKFHFQKFEAKIRKKPEFGACFFPLSVCLAGFAPPDCSGRTPQ
jgi:hypothetical protein